MFVTKHSKYSATEEFGFFCQ